MDLSILDNKYFIGIGSAIASIFITILIQRILNRRGRLRYFVVHNRVGMSTDDAVFGSVRVTWNETEIANLYLSTIELVNESLRDYENVVVRVFTNNTSLLSERTEIVGTTQVLNWTNDFANQLQVAPGQQPTEAQQALANRQRDYLIPTMNRGQTVRYSFINAAMTQDQPAIWLDILHPGIRLKFGVQHQKFLGVSAPLAALVGSIFGLTIVLVMVYSIQSVFLIGILSFLVGLSAQIPGAFIVKIWRWLRDVLGG